jgi:hypothetical protein
LIKCDAEKYKALAGLGIVKFDDRSSEKEKYD